ncbi:hypothetical protein Ais01nite_11340 [Asanoa ishikariensis]|uniref:Sigma-70, region 4 n=1 Tax=Asanoa ishikariensis TaxID=137265 RepID=A0A1H3T307_9ACTN|nr:hypothetical protein [Asanoa ishikariensis]GIF63099.1 hypothetical protein Ais01nite_11340 [Asanoa ishikariensis]SDZ44317.1 hypothetical protein SAMN05421684_5094 [Asanoa ishikariensis]
MTIRALPASITTIERRRRAHGRALCRHHAGPLLCLAAILLDDIDAASDVVAATLATACRPIQYPRASSGHTRVALARSVFWRCIGRLAAIERFGTATRRSAGTPEAILALTVFGGHDLKQAAQTLQIPETDVERQVRELMSVIAPDVRQTVAAARLRVLPPLDATV